MRGERRDGRWSGRRRGTWVAAAVVAAVLVIAGPAQASSCTYIPQTHDVAMYMAGSADAVQLGRVGNAIANFGVPCSDGATEATVYNTDAVFVNDTSPGQDGNDLAHIDLGGGPLAPGVTDEGPSGVSEIEIFLNLHYGQNTVWVTGTDGADNIHAGIVGGVMGINLNAGAEQGKVSDADVTWLASGAPNYATEEPIIFDGGNGNDTFDASGGAGFNGPAFHPITMMGGNGDDHLTGGVLGDTFVPDAGNDVIDGGGDLEGNTVTYQDSPVPATVDLSNPGPQNTGALGTDQFAHIDRLIGSPYDDVLTGSDGDNVVQGGGGNDVLTGRGGDDKLDGGPGNDTASYRSTPAGATQGVKVNLGITTKQDTGGAGWDTLTGIENLAGSPFDDELTGDGHANTLTGWEGQDSLNGEGGDDHLAVRDGTRDLVTCGTGADSVDADQQGVDSIFGDCESTAFAPAPPPPATQPSAQPGTSPGGSPGTTPPDTMAPLLDKLALHPRTFSTARSRLSDARVTGTQVTYRLSEAATVTFDAQRAAAGRRVGGRCVRPTRHNRKARQCRRWLHVRGTFIASGLTGSNRLHFSGRLAGKRLPTATYLLRAIATDMAGNRSRSQTVRFTIVS
jgi:Ca2+-binding RTX toxin-like protein